MKIQDIGNQLVEVFNKFSKVQKISIITAAVAIATSIAVLAFWANKPVYKALYANLSQEDSGQIIAKLKEKKIPYSIKDDGKTIEIPNKMVYETRLELAQSGIPKGGGTGFELFDKNALGMTEFAQNVNYQRALQGELSRTISSLGEIEEARVHLTIPKDRLFLSDEGESKAAVVVKLAKDVSLNRDKVKAIASLVAGAVKGLKTKDVQIVDTAGNLLSEALNEENEPMVRTQTQLDYQKKVEKLIASKINHMLSTALGDGNATAQVTAEIDFDKKEVTKEEYDPNSVLRSQQTIEINSKNSPNTPQGTPGVEPNLAEPNIQNNATNSEYSKTEETQNFEITKTTTKQQISQGYVKRLTIAVVVNDKKQIVTKDKKEEIKYIPRTQEELTKIRNLVANSAGFDDKRGDKIEVNNVSFDTTSQTAESSFLAREKMNELILQISKYAIGLVMLLLFYFLVMRPILKKLGEVKETKEGTLSPSGDSAKGSNLDIVMDDDIKFPKTIDELEKEIESELNESVAVDVSSVKTKVMLKKIEEAVAEDPTMLANLIKAWIKEG